MQQDAMVAGKTAATPHKQDRDRDIRYYAIGQ